MIERKIVGRGYCLWSESRQIVTTGNTSGFFITWPLIDWASYNQYWFHGWVHLTNIEGWIVPWPAAVVNTSDQTSRHIFEGFDMLYWHVYIRLLTTSLSLFVFINEFGVLYIWAWVESQHQKEENKTRARERGKGRWERDEKRDEYKMHLKNETDIICSSNNIMEQIIRLW